MEGVPGTLFVVGSPIGNLEDLTPRAARVLGSVAAVAAEDTRRTRGLLSHLGVHPRLLSLPAEAERERSEAILRVLRDGADVALVTDAGMPGISDPGTHLVGRCLDEDIPVRVVPGPSAALAALVVSGFAADRWTFEGFLPRRGRTRAERLAAIAADPRPSVVFESPRRTAATLADLSDACGSERSAVVARELTKVHEEVLRGPLARLAGDLAERELKGEVAIVIEGAPPPAAPQVDDALLAEEGRSLTATGMRAREAAAEVARRHGVPANRVYSAMLR
ncbi:MAG: 16S rRNA (cytidine(1402)-2'-O)-methyltransferase [Actinomycetota bacterium]